MPRERMFLYLCMCRYGYLKNEQKQSKTEKNEHKTWKSVNSRNQGSNLSKKKPKMQFKSLKIQRMTKETLSESVKILTRKILQVFTSCRFWSFEELRKKSQLKSSKSQEMHLDRSQSLRLVLSCISYIL